MRSPINSIINLATRKQTEPIRVLTALTHESYESNLCLTNCEFYALPGPHIKPFWNESFRKRPPNYHILPSQEIPSYIDFHCVLSQQKFSQYGLLAPTARQLHLPLICLEHTQPTQGFNQQHIQRFNEMRGDINIFISKFSQNAWGFDDSNSIVIKHAVNTDVFKPDGRVRKLPYILNVGNDIINRSQILGTDIFKRVTEGLKTRLVGDTKGISEPSKGIDDLVNEYRQATVFLNCTRTSPIPSVCLESASCGLPVVSTDTAAIGEYLSDGCFLSNNEKDLREMTEFLLTNPHEASIMGEKARGVMLNNFTLDRFVNEWNGIFERVSNFVFRR